MLGFELMLNGVIKRASLENGVVSVNITRVKAGDRDELDVSFTGFDPKTEDRIVWYSINLKKGDVVEVKAVDVEESSKPQSTSKLHPGKTVLEAKLKTYHSLKKELEEAGVI